MTGSDSFLVRFSTSASCCGCIDVYLPCENRAALVPSLTLLPSNQQVEEKFCTLWQRFIPALDFLVLGRDLFCLVLPESVLPMRAGILSAFSRVR